MTVIEAVESAPWAMLPEWISRVHTIASREHETSPEALEAYRGMSLARAEKATRRDGVAIISMIGPMFRRANMMTEISGATSYDIIRRDLQAAVDDPSVKAILLNIDSPGGQANGTDELAKAIFDVRGKKPITAYIGGTGASAAYWLAAAADEIVISDSAILGSIGVYMAVIDEEARDEKRGIKKIEFVSSQTPNKNQSLSSAEGREGMQRTIDALAEVFIAAVAEYRGVKAEVVTTKYGRGGVEVGAHAIALGMADRIGTFEGVLAALSNRSGANRFQQRSGGYSMSDTTNAPAAGFSQADIDSAVAKARDDAKAAYQARVTGILACDDAKALPTLANHLAFSTDLDADAAKAILGVAKADAKASAPAAPTAQEREQEYLARKTEAGAITGIVPPEKGADATAGWDKAKARAGLRTAS
ncbi:MAG: S49 family peptidase [Salinarimonadaceae bacterium]|nr:MAG: S49 family peptidase [Salinarimonadaceae bacterium]